MKIDVRTNECVYITLNGWVYYIDDSTNEQILWKSPIEKIIDERIEKERKDENE